MNERLRKRETKIADVLNDAYVGMDEKLAMTWALDGTSRVISPRCALVFLTEAIGSMQMYSVLN